MNPQALLFLPESPYPPRCGNAWRDAQEIHLLRELGYDISLALMLPRHDLTPAEELQGLGGMTARYAGARRGAHEPIPAALWRKASYVLGSKRNAFAWWAEKSKPGVFLHQTVGEVQPAIVVMRSLFVHLLPKLRQAFRGLVIVDCHDADVHLAEEMVRMVSGLRKLGPWTNLQAVRRSFRAYLPLADEVWAVSYEDADRIRRDVRTAKVLVVPSGLEPVPDPRPRPGDDRTVLIVANYGYGPNARGVAWLLSDVWPLVRQSIPDACLELVGGRMPKELYGLASRTPGVRVHGMLEKLDSFYEQAGIVAVPILEGSGTRLKVVDAWRHGKAVVTTTKGVEGLPHALGAFNVANTRAEFTEAIWSLLREPVRRHEMGQRALDAFKSILSFEAIHQRVIRSSVIANHRRIGGT